MIVTAPTRQDPCRLRPVNGRTAPRFITAAPPVRKSGIASMSPGLLSEVLLVPLLPFGLVGGGRVVVEDDEVDVGLASALWLDAVDDRNEVEVGVVASLHGRLALRAGHEGDELH